MNGHDLCCFVDMEQSVPALLIFIMVLINIHGIVYAFKIIQWSLS